MSRARDWLALLLPGDWAVMLLGAALVAASFALLWRGGSADRAVVRRDGQVVAELPLSAPKKVTIPGAIGDTIVEIQPGRARVLSDPGLHQYCVKQG
ncbi:MAG TPA: NusG domain II-containing protein, partial [Rhodocyclaceae bacterium]